MKLTRSQEIGLRTAIERYKSHQPYTVISGYAGSGKSTLIKHIVAALDIDPNLVAYISYCGKACQVLRNKGCTNAVTAHKLLYKSIRQRDGTFKHYPRLELERDYKLIIVDEASMLPQNMWELLLSHHVYVIACGDPGLLK